MEPPAACPPKREWKRTELILIRHAESFNNSLNELIRNVHGSDISEELFAIEEARLRHHDCGLSDDGVEQARLLGDHFEREGVKGIRVKRERRTPNSSLARKRLFLGCGTSTTRRIGRAASLSASC